MRGPRKRLSPCALAALLSLHMASLAVVAVGVVLLLFGVGDGPPMWVLAVFGSSMVLLLDEARPWV